MTIPSQDSKVCRKCGIEKPKKDFYLKWQAAPNKIRNVVDSHCKKCVIVKRGLERKAWSPERKLKENADERARNKCTKAAVFAAYGGFTCKCCGESEPLFMTIDHINNDGAHFRKTVLGRFNAAGVATYQWIVKNDFPSGFQVLCMNCQWGKRMNKGVCPHRVRRNDQTKVVESSDSKRNAPFQIFGKGEEMVSSALKDAAALTAGLV